MKIAITVGVDAKGQAKIIPGPDVPRAEQRKSFKSLKAAGLGDKWAAIIFADGPHVVRSKTPPPPPAKEPTGKK